MRPGRWRFHLCPHRDLIRQEGRHPITPFLLPFPPVCISTFHSSLLLFCTAPAPSPASFLSPSHSPAWGAQCQAWPLEERNLRRASQSPRGGSSGNAPSAGARTRFSLCYFFLTAAPRLVGLGAGDLSGESSLPRSAEGGTVRILAAGTLGGWGAGVCAKRLNPALPGSPPPFAPGLEVPGVQLAPKKGPRSFYLPIPSRPWIQDDTSHTNTIPSRGRYSGAPCALELQLGVRFRARPGLEPPARGLRSPPRPPGPAALALEPSPPRGALSLPSFAGEFLWINKSVCSFGFVLFFFCSLLLNLPPRSSFFFSNFSFPSSFSLSFRSLSFLTLSLPLFCLFLYLPFLFWPFLCLWVPGFLWVSLEGPFAVPG